MSCIQNLLVLFCKTTQLLLLVQRSALSFYRSQNILDWSKFFGPDQKLIYIFCQSHTFCATSKDSVNLVFGAGTKVFEEALNAITFLDWLKKYGPAQNILGPVEGQGKSHFFKKSLNNHCNLLIFHWK